MQVLIFMIGISLAFALECNIHGRCINSDILELTNATSGNECHQNCKNVQGCEWYTFDQGAKNTCELFTNCNELSIEDCDNCESGQVDCILIQNFSKSYFLFGEKQKFNFLSSQIVDYCKSV